MHVFIQRSTGQQNRTSMFRLFPWQTWQSSPVASQEAASYILIYFWKLTDHCTVLQSVARHRKKRLEAGGASPAANAHSGNVAAAMESVVTHDGSVLLTIITGCVCVVKMHLVFLHLGQPSSFSLDLGGLLVWVLYDRWTGGSPLLCQQFEIIWWEHWMMHWCSVSAAVCDPAMRRMKMKSILTWLCYRTEWTFVIITYQNAMRWDISTSAERGWSWRQPAEVSNNSPELHVSGFLLVPATLPHT